MEFCTGEKQCLQMKRTTNSVTFMKESTKYFICHNHVITLRYFYALHSRGFISLQETRKHSIRIMLESVNWGQMWES
jgi:hypothetical protein